MVTNTKHRQEFRDKADKFIRAVIRHRRLLITEGKSTTNKMKSEKIIENLTNNLDNTNYTNKGMARFFIKHADDIRYLIKHDAVDKFNTFNQLFQLSQTHQYL